METNVLRQYVEQVMKNQDAMLDRADRIIALLEKLVEPKKVEMHNACCGCTYRDLIATCPPCSDCREYDKYKSADSQLVQDLIAAGG